MDIFSDFQWASHPAETQIPVFYNDFQPFPATVIVSLWTWSGTWTNLSSSHVLVRSCTNLSTIHLVHFTYTITGPTYWVTFLWQFVTYRKATLTTFTVCGVPTIRTIWFCRFRELDKATTLFTAWLILFQGCMAWSFTNIDHFSLISYFTKTVGTAELISIWSLHELTYPMLKR